VIVWGEIECLSLLEYKEKNSSKVHLKGDYILWIWVRPFRRKTVWGRGVGRGQYREAPPERGAFFEVAVYLRVGKLVILGYDRVTKSAAKSKRWLLKRSIWKGAKFWQKWQRETHEIVDTLWATEPEGLKAWEKCGDYRKFFCFGLSLRYKKGVLFCSRCIKGVPFW